MLAPIPPAHIINQNVPVALAERAQGGEVSGGVRVRGPGAEPADGEIPDIFGKSADGGGSAGVAGPDRGIEDQLRLYVDAVTQVLDANRGSWGQGVFFTGGYEVNFDPVQHGGQNFLQIAKVTLEVDLSE